MGFPNLRTVLLSVMAALVMMTSTSCIELIERINVNKDGSGSWDFVIDMGPMLATMMAMAGDEEEDPDKEYEKYDSLFYYKDSPDSIKALWENKALMERSMITMHADEKNLEMSVTIHTEFENVSEITTFQKDMMHIGDGGSFFEPDEDGDGFMSMGEGDPVEFSMKNGVFSRGEDDLSGFGKMDKEERQMMEMFMTDASYTVEITLPEEISKSTSKAYKVKGNTAKAEVNLMDYMQGKGKLKTDLKTK